MNCYKSEPVKQEESPKKTKPEAKQEEGIESFSGHRLSSKDKQEAFETTLKIKVDGSFVVDQDATKKEKKNGNFLINKF